jgi:hypothetical protein
MDDLVDQARPRDQDRLLEQATGFGHGWMAATPSNNSHTTFSSEEYTLGLKWWLGLPVLNDVSQPCTGCNQPLDKEGDHLLCCRRNDFATTLFRTHCSKPCPTADSGYRRRFPCQRPEIATSARPTSS